MPSDISDTELARRQAAMKALNDDDRADAIDAAPNVVGFERFQHRATQVMLRDAYRKPQKPKPGGQV